MPEFADRIMFWFFAAFMGIGIPVVVVNDIRAGRLIGSGGFAERMLLVSLAQMTLATLLTRWLAARRWRRSLAVGLILAGIAWLAWGIWRWPIPPLGLPDETTILMYAVTGGSLAITAWRTRG